MVELKNFSSINQTERNLGSTSNKYSFIPTTRIIEDLARENWLPASASEVSARKNVGFQKHLIRFRNDDFTGQFDGDCQPEIVLTNAHNGLASFQLMAGLIRFACANGMIVHDGLIANHKIRHQGYTQQIVKEAVYNILEDMPKVYNSVERFKEIKLTDDERIAFAKSSLSLVYDEKQLDNMLVDETAQALAAPRRKSDLDNTLWNTFNTVQEKFIKGARFMRESKQVELYGGGSYSRTRTRKTKETKSIDKNVKINKALWQFTEEVARLKVAA